MESRNPPEQEYVKDDDPKDDERAERPKEAEP